MLQVMRVASGDCGSGRKGEDGTLRLYKMTLALHAESSLWRQHPVSVDADSRCQSHAAIYWLPVEFSRSLQSHHGDVLMPSCMRVIQSL